MYLNGIEEHGNSILPFGKPLGLYQEFSFEDKEVLSRKGAQVEMKFHLSYQYHEEQVELPEYDTEYKAIMKAEMDYLKDMIKYIQEKNQKHYVFP